MKSLSQLAKIIFGFGMKSKVNTAEFIEDKKCDAGFAEFYKCKIKPNAQRIEELRMKNLKKLAFNARAMFFAPSIIWLGMFTYSFAQKLHVSLLDIKMIFFVVFTILNPVFLISVFLSVTLIYIVLSFLICDPISKFRQEASEEFSKIFFEFFGDFQYEKERNEDSIIWDYKQFKILPIVPFRRISSATNNISGTCRNVGMHFEDIHIGQRIRSKLYFEITFFRGAAILLNIGNDMGDLTVILQKKFGNWSFKYRSGLQKVGIEELELKKMFDVYSNDNQRVKNLITTSFATEFKKLPNLFRSKKLQAGFCDQKLFLALDGSSGLFEFSVFKETDLVKESRFAIERMNALLRLVEILKNDQRENSVDRVSN